MPCRCEPKETVYTVTARYKDKVNKLEAMLCAILTELELHSVRNSGTLDDFNQFIKKTEESGQVNIRDFINKHKKEDEDRLQKELSSKFSKHELEQIKRMYEKGEIK